MLVSYLYPFIYTYIVVKVNMKNKEVWWEGDYGFNKEPTSLLLWVI